MESRIISIYCHQHPTEYWYDIDNKLKDKKYFIESQLRGNGTMHISESDEIYILCRYSNKNVIKYRCKVSKVNMESDLGEDSYEHNSNGQKSSHYFKAELIETYQDGNFPLETLRELGLVSKHNQLNGDKMNKLLIDYIAKNKVIVEI